MEVHRGGAETVERGERDGVVPAVILIVEIRRNGRSWKRIYVRLGGYDYDTNGMNHPGRCLVRPECVTTLHEVVVKARAGDKAITGCKG